MAMGPGFFDYLKIDELNAKIRALEFLVKTRERELLIAKGPCRNEECMLHYAHSGPCG